MSVTDPDFAASPPMAGAVAPTGVCSRWLGDHACAAPAVVHIIWDYEINNGAVCAAHDAEAQRRWAYIGRHAYADACRADGHTRWNPTGDFCYRDAA